MLNKREKIAVEQKISEALGEDAARRDITTVILTPSKFKSKALVVAKQKAVLAGIQIAARVFTILDKSLKVKCLVPDGSIVKPGTHVLSLEGSCRSILSAERTALNFLGFLSGISTLTAEFIARIKPYKVQILDTRKTTPGLRALERYAVRCGGGYNHRFNLEEMVLVKDNHRIACKNHENLAETVRRLRAKTTKKIEVEVDTLEEFFEVVESAPDMILLDNMSVRDMRTAVSVTRKRRGRKILLEASGGVTLENIGRIAQTGVDRISIGALTHSPKSIDFSLELLTTKRMEQ